MKYYAMAVVGALLLAGCSGSQGTTAAPQPVSGVFIDGPVKGVKYVFGHYSGLTGTGGTFSCEDGQVGEFRVGNILLGHAACAPVITVLDLVNYDYGAMPPSDALTKVSPAVQFLLSVGTVSSDGAVEVPESACVRAASESINIYTADTATLRNVARAVTGNPDLTFVNASTASNHLAGSLSKIYQARHAGEYVSTSWNNTGVADLVVHPDGEISGYLLNSVWVYQMAGSVSWDGSYTLRLKNAPTRDTAGESSGYSDARGTLTGTTYDGTAQPFQYVMQRVSSTTNKYYGIYKGTISYSTGASGDLWFGVDGNGVVHGFAPGWGKYMYDAGILLEGHVDGKTGAMSLAGGSMSGTITSTGTVANGAFQSPAASGTFSASRLTAQ